MSAWFSADHPGLVDFWRVYQEHYDTILSATMAAACAHAELKPIIDAMTPELLAQQNQASRARLERAIGGAWDEYEAELRLQGSTYAKLGISVSAWYDLVGSFQRQLVPLLIAAYVSEPARLAGAIAALQSFVDRAMVIIA